MATLHLELPLHSVICTVGVAGCGKSTFCRERLEPTLLAHLTALGLPRPKVVTLSLADEDEGNIAARLAALMTYPGDTHYIIVDSDGLSLEQHRAMKAVVEAQAYNMVSLTWLFRDPADYGAQREDVAVQRTLLEESVFKALPKIFPVRNRIASLQQARESPLSFETPGVCEMVNAQLPVDREYLIIGDTHECVPELQSLLVAAGFTIDATRRDLICSSPGQLHQRRRDIVLVGDYLDKGGATREMLEFLHRNVFLSEDEQTDERAVTLRIVRGNHELSNFNLLTQRNKWMKMYGREHVERFYTALATLCEEPDLAEKFLQLYAVSKAFVFFSGSESARPFFVTHAPCEVQFIGKVDERSQRKQTYTYMRRDIPLARQLAKLISPNHANAPLQVTGHVNLAEVYQGDAQDNNYWIGVDTGCVVGGKLSGVLLGHDRCHAQVLQVPSTRIALQGAEALQHVHTLEFRQVRHLFSST